MEKVPKSWRIFQARYSNPYTSVDR